MFDRYSLMKKKCEGFSLVEMLTTVAVIGIMAAMAIPAISRIDDKASLTSAKRNAQEAAALSASANVLGIEHVVADINGGVKSTLEFLSNGIEKADGSGLLVQLNLTPKQIDQAAKFLQIQHLSDYNQLIYAGDVRL